MNQLIFEMLNEALDFITDMADVIDGPYGPQPNKAMLIAADLRDVISKIEDELEELEKESK